MAIFTISAIRPDKSIVALKYDNQTSALTWADTGQPVVKVQETKWGTVVAVSHDQPGHKHDIKKLKISLGLSCNYACSYCSQRFVPHKVDAGLDDVAPFLTNLAKWFDPSGKDGKGDGIQVEFWGGEPLVYIKTMKPLAEALRIMMPKATFVMITNGSLLTPEINAWLEAMEFDIGISHDGPGQHVRGPDPLANPEQRAAIMDLYRRLHPRGKISINAMINRQNQSRDAIQTWMQEQFGADVRIGEGAFVDPYDADGLAAMLNDEEHHAYRIQALKAIRENKADKFNVVQSKMVEFINSIRKARPASSVGQKCGMDRSDNIAVTLKGDVMTCQNVSPIAKAPNGESHKIGHVDKLSEVRLNTATHWSNRPECSDCPVLQLCKGACMFLQGEYWEAACNTSFSDNIPYFAGTIEYLTGALPFHIEGPQRDDRKNIWQKLQPEA